MMARYDARLGLYIGGEWLGVDGRDTSPVLDPATGAELARLPLATDEDLDRALEAAQRGFELWRATPGEQRAEILMRTAALLQERAEHLATLATLEQGKIKAEALLEVNFGASLLKFHAGEAMRIWGRVLPRAPGSRSLVLQQPIGPVAAFCAWNFPIMNVLRKLGPALAAGCSIIIKPSEETPGSAVEVLRCFADAGLPGDVAQCLFGVPDAVSARLLASPVTRKLSFTGSVAVGKHLARLAADTMMVSTMELGGHGPVLVFDDCDLERTVDQLIAHKFRNAGQTCIAPTRFHVQEGIYERFASAFAERSRGLRIGHGLAADSQMGPLANRRRRHVIDELVEDAAARGGRVLAGGKARGEDGFFFEPTVIADVDVAARAMNEEPFGPVALLHPFATIEQAIAEANRLPYALAAYCFTENGRRQNLLGDAIEAGMIGINSIRLSAPDSPFGGIKDSGHGSEDGPEGVAAHLVTKTVHMA